LKKPAGDIPENSDCHHVVFALCANIRYISKPFQFFLYR
jgi:hypothetical protein